MVRTNIHLAPHRLHRKKDLILDESCHNDLTVHFLRRFGVGWKLLDGCVLVKLLRFGNSERFKVFVVIVIVPLILNTIQFVIQDTFLKKSDFEITDVEVMRKYYDCTEGEDLETSLNANGGSSQARVELGSKADGNIADKDTALSTNSNPV